MRLESKQFVILVPPLIVCLLILRLDGANICRAMNGYSSFYVPSVSFLRSFHTKGHLQEHILGLHDKSRIYYCPVCSKPFQTQKRVTKHIRHSHKDVSEQYSTFKKLEVFD